MDNEHTRTYEVDEAMLGQNWLGDTGALREFVDLLNEELDEEGLNIEAIAIIDSCNGAEYNSDAGTDADKAWHRAIERTPVEWWEL